MVHSVTKMKIYFCSTGRKSLPTAKIYSKVFLQDIILAWIVLSNLILPYDCYRLEASNFRKFP
jgi:hypothetical protein